MTDESNDVAGNSGLDETAAEPEVVTAAQETSLNAAADEPRTRGTRRMSVTFADLLTAAGAGVAQA